MWISIQEALLGISEGCAEIEGFLKDFEAGIAEFTSETKNVLDIAQEESEALIHVQDGIQQLDKNSVRKWTLSSSSNAVLL